MIRMLFRSAAVAALAAATALAACSSNAGFGTPPPNAGPVSQATNPPGVSGSPVPISNAESSATPSTPLIVDSASARLAYDASADDPMKAPRLVEITFALNNPGASPIPVSNLAIAADVNPAASVPLTLKALPNQDTIETLVAVAPPKDISKTKQLNLTFGDGKNVLLAQSTIDFPTNVELSMTALDKKARAGGLSVDDVAVTGIAAPGKGLHYDLTFSLTNAGTTKASIAYLIVTPPKGDAVKIAVAIELPGRTATSPLNVVVPYADKKAKALPDGKYSIAASDGTNTIATGSGPLL